MGRAIRLSPEKLKGTIIIPVFISDGDDPDTVLNSSEFDKVWKVVNALRSHDDALGEELDNLRIQLGKQGSTARPSKIVFDIPVRIGDQFATAFDTRMVEATTSSWHYWFGLLTTYVEQEGHARPKSNFKTAEGYPLGSWVNAQRTKRSTLSPERQAQLEALLGWVWDALEHQWGEGFAHLEAFVHREGHARPPYNFKTADGYPLGWWVSNRRLKKSTLPPERQAQLGALPGWVWDAREHQWVEGFTHMKAFVHREGHARPPQSFKTSEGFPLGGWVSEQRMKKSTLPPERQAQLEALPGWVWDALEHKWGEGFGHLEAFVNREGHARPAQGFKTTDGFRLGVWVSRLRGARSTLSPERQAQLEALPGWVWDVLEYQWGEGFAHLEAFVHREGHARPPSSFKTSDGFPLGVWVGTLRRRKSKLLPENLAQLEALPGWVWNVLEHQWAEGFGHLEAFVHREGHARPPSSFKTSDGYALGNWVVRQHTRKSALSPERQAQLEALPGWVWDEVEHLWEEGFAQLKAFVQREGHARPSQSFKTEGGFLLAAWVSRQRGARNTLSSERQAQLEALRGWTWDAYEHRWEKGFAYLEAFLNREGHARPSKNFKTADGYALGGWVSYQRRKKSMLSPERQAQLQALPGWTWEPYDYMWSEGYAHLEAFVEREGHARPTRDRNKTDGYALGLWVSDQRYKKSTLSSERRTQLEALPGWVWDVIAHQWSEGFAHLKAFVDREGHARPAQSFKTADGYALGRWVHNLRITKGSQSPERQAQLEALPGWVWEPHEHSWNRGFTHLEAFVYREGHARPARGFKTVDGYALGRWVSDRRNKKSILSPERQAELEALPGWTWEPYDHMWSEGYAHLEAFVQVEGHARPENSFKTADGYALGQWVSRQRKTKSILSPERKAQLEALPGWVWKAQ